MGTIHNRTYEGIILGMGIRGSIANLRTFRVRRGNGFYNSKIGTRYQDQYIYFVPVSINNPEGQAARNALTTAVSNWQGFSTEQKKVYNKRAMSRGNMMSGFNLYVGEYIKVNA